MSGTAQEKYVFHNDPGHGWLAVKLAELVRIGIANKISPFSYQRGDMVYLEEDCDAAAFDHAKKALGEDYKCIDRYKDKSAVRGYAQYMPPVLQQS